MPIGWTPPSPILVVDDHGPVRGALVYGVSDPPFEDSYHLLGRTDRSGTCSAPNAREGFHLVAQAPDGRITAGTYGTKLVFGKRGEIRLRLTNFESHPLRGIPVSLDVSDVDKTPLKSAFVLFSIPNYPAFVPPCMRAKTDAEGWVTFHNLSAGRRFAVIASPPKSSSMAFEGSISPGETKKLLVSNRCSIDGTVVDPNGRPLKNVVVSLTEPNADVVPVAGEGQSHSIRETRTDSLGRYRFDRLPNCELDVDIDMPEKKPGGVYAIQRRWNRGSWRSTGFAYWPDGLGQPKGFVSTYDSYHSQPLVNQSNRVDFRLSKPCQVKVEIQNPKRFKLKV